MVQICKDEGVWSVIDAAHSIGQEVDLDLGKVAPDFWVSVSFYSALKDFMLFDNDIIVIIELSQMVVWQTLMRSSICSRTVRESYG